MSGGGKGGSQTTTVAIPAYLEDAIQRNISRAEDISKIGFVPYYGPDVAAMTPMQEAAMQSTGMAAQAYGLPNALGNQIVPEPQSFAGGVRGYSSGDLYDQAVAELKARRPGQYDAIMNQFIDPFTGQPAQSAEPDTSAEDFYRSMGYQPVQPHQVLGRSSGVVRTPSGQLFMSPDDWRNAYGR